MMNCMFSKAGKNEEICLNITSLNEEDFKLNCLKNLNNDYWNTYVTFFVHSDNLCYFYQS